MNPKPGQWSQQDPHICPDRWREYVAACCRAVDAQVHAAACEGFVTRVREAWTLAVAMSAQYEPAMPVAASLRAAFDSCTQALQQAKQDEIDAVFALDQMRQEGPCRN